MAYGVILHVSGAAVTRIGVEDQEAQQEGVAADAQGVARGGREEEEESAPMEEMVVSAKHVRFSSRDLPVVNCMIEDQACMLHEAIHQGPGLAPTASVRRTAQNKQCTS